MVWLITISILQSTFFDLDLLLFHGLYIPSSFDLPVSIFSFGNLPILCLFPIANLKSPLLSVLFTLKACFTLHSCLLCFHSYVGVINEYIYSDFATVSSFLVMASGKSRKGSAIVIWGCEVQESILFSIQMNLSVLESWQLQWSMFHCYVLLMYLLHIKIPHDTVLWYWYILGLGGLTRKCCKSNFFMHLFSFD